MAGEPADRRNGRHSRGPGAGLRPALGTTGPGRAGALPDVGGDRAARHHPAGAAAVPVEQSAPGTGAEHGPGTRRRPRRLGLPRGVRRVRRPGAGADHRLRPVRPAPLGRTAAGRDRRPAALPHPGRAAQSGLRRRAARARYRGGAGVLGGGWHGRAAGCPGTGPVQGCGGDGRRDGGDGGGRPRGAAGAGVPAPASEAAARTVVGGLDGCRVAVRLGLLAVGRLRRHRGRDDRPAGPGPGRTGADRGAGAGRRRGGAGRTGGRGARRCRRVTRVDTGAAGFGGRERRCSGGGPDCAGCT